MFALAVIVTALPQIVADLSLGEDDALRIAGLLAIVQVYVNLLVTFRTLDHAGAAPPGYHRADLTERRFGSAFAMSLLSTLAILAGLALLIVPGVLLILLLSLATPALAAERATAIGSLRRSWRLARPALAPLLAVLAPIASAALLVCAGVFAAAWQWEQATLAETLIVNLLLSALSPFAASTWTFAYLGPREDP